MNEWDFARQIEGAVSVDWKKVESVIQDSGLAADYDEVVEIANEIEDEIRDGVESGAAAVFTVQTKQ